MREEIRPIEGYPGYFVGDTGKVYSAWIGSGRGAKPTGPLRELLLSFSGGRMQVNLHRAGRNRTYRVHNLVLTAFVGPRPKGMDACHFPDRDTRNNHLDNLRWDTKAANAADKIVHGTTNRGERNGGAKLTRDQVGEIRQLCRAGETQVVVAARFGVSRSMVANIEQGRNWQWLS